MPNNISHFSIHADDVNRAKSFYEKVFGWTFSAWGPPGFWMIRTGTEADPGIHGALQKRHEPVDGRGVIAFECTITVEDVDATAKAVVENGGKIVTPKMHIPTVGWLVQFQDTESNLVGAMRYEGGH